MKIFSLFLIFIIENVSSMEEDQSMRSNLNKRSLPPPYIIHNSVNNPMNKIGITNKIAELVTTSFGSIDSPYKKYHPKESLILVKDDSDEYPTPPNHLMSGMLKMLGFDSRKLGAIAVNGFVFMAKMVRYGASRVMDFLSEQTFDWYKIMSHISEKMKSKTYAGRRRKFHNFHFLE